MVKTILETENCFDQSYVLKNRTETVHGTLRSLFLSQLLYGTCVKIFIVNRYIQGLLVYFKELHNDQEYYWLLNTIENITYYLSFSEQH